ncbi:MAG: DUF5667 domain-containing protein, partial [Anaerolineae bacterium]
MAEGNGASSDGRLGDALDRCIAALRRGDSLEDCLAEYPELAHRLLPLLEMAAKLMASRREAPAAPGGLEAGRRRLAGLAADLALPGTEPVSAALDAALARVTSGAAIATVLAEFPGHAEALEALLAVAEGIDQDIVSPPAADLAAGRRRLVMAAAVARSAGAAPNPDAAAALDAALAAGDQGADLDPESPVADLVATAKHLRAAAIPAPAPVSGLVQGRRRMLEAAGRARSLHRRRATTAPGVAGPAAAALRQWAAAARRWVPRGIPSPAIPSPAIGPRVLRPSVVTISTALALALVLGSSLILAPAAASALPGQPLYPVKRLNERLSLAVAVAPDRRAALRREYSARRAQELQQVVADDAAAKIEDWEARFLNAWLLENTDDDVGRFRVATLGQDGQPITVTLAWEHTTRFELGERVNSLVD